MKLRTLHTYVHTAELPINQPIKLSITATYSYIKPQRNVYLTPSTRHRRPHTPHLKYLTPITFHHHRATPSSNTIKVQSEEPYTKQIFHEMETHHVPLSPMEYRFLGRSGLKVSAISIGGWYVRFFLGGFWLLNGWMDG